LKEKKKRRKEKQSPVDKFLLDYLPDPIKEKKKGKIGLAGIRELVNGLTVRP